MTPEDLLLEALLLPAHLDRKRTGLVLSGSGKAERTRKTKRMIRRMRTKMKDCWRIWARRR